VPARDVAAARAAFGDAVAAYLDGGTLDGAPSTVAIVEGGRLRVLREGRVPRAALDAALTEET
jgi:tRNA A37 threonylcarbamoyladenosine synthetase subunit TsaC/SUA5/YrdC